MRERERKSNESEELLRRIGNSGLRIAGSNSGSEGNGMEWNEHGL